MTTHAKNDTIAVQAAEDLSSQAARFKVISFGGVIAPGTSRAAGINITSTRSGEIAAAQYSGIVKVTAGGAVNTLGFPLTCAASGFMTACASGGLAYGRALETCASGDLVQAFVEFKSPSAWPGI